MTMPRKIIDEFTDLPVSAIKKMRLRRQRDGLCVECGKRRDVMHEFRCAACNAHAVARYASNREKYRARGLCPKCANPLGEFGHCPNCLELLREWRARQTDFDASRYASRGNARLTNPITKMGSQYAVRMFYVNRKPTVCKYFRFRDYRDSWSAKRAAIRFAMRVLKQRGAEYDRDVVVCDLDDNEERKRRKEAVTVPVYVGTGREGVRKAKALGASKKTLSYILRGLQDAVSPAISSVPSWATDGIVNHDLTDVADELRRWAEQYRPRWMSDVETAEVIGDALLRYASVDLSDKDEDYPRRLVCKIMSSQRKKRNQQSRRRRSLDDEEGRPYGEVADAELVDWEHESPNHCDFHWESDYDDE